MSIINSSNAIPAKARAKYGKRLTEKDYKNLTVCKSVSEVVSYLKYHTHYSAMLTKVNEYNAHRGQIEMLLKRKLFYDFDSLCRYEMSLGASFSLYIVRRYEISQLIHFLTLLNSGRTEDYIFTMPEYFNKHTDIHLYELLHAKNYSEFLYAVRNSPYEAILKEYSPTDASGIINIADIENKLYFFLYSELYEAIAKQPKNDREELKKLIDNLIDFINFDRIYRLTAFYHMDIEEVKARLLPFGTLTHSQIEKLYHAESKKKLISVFSEMPVGRPLKKMRYNYFNEIPTRVKFNAARKNMYFSGNPAVVLLSYVFVTDIELFNITNIIESVRYGLAAEEIENLLIYK